MKPLSSKQMVRMEKKKKKMAALLEIAKLNAHDRDIKSSATLENETVLENTQSVKEPSPKRLRTENECKKDEIEQTKLVFHLFC